MSGGAKPNSSTKYNQRNSITSGSIEKDAYQKEKTSIEIK